MISTTRRSPNATLVTKDAIDQASDALQDLPEKTKEKLSLREAVDVLRDHITAALDKGYSYDDIAVMLAKQGVTIAPSSLKHYLARSNRQLKAKGGQTRRRRTMKSVEESMEDLQAPEPEEIEAPKRGRKAAAKTTAPAPKATTRSASTRAKAVPASPSTRKRRGKAGS